MILNGNWPFEELQKAFLIVLMSTAMSNWDCKIGDDSAKASHVARYSPDTIRSWMKSYRDSIFLKHDEQWKRHYKG